MNNQNIIATAINGINFRSLSSAIRFSIPIGILFISNESQLGLYYLALSILLTGSTFLGIELGYFFSTKYLSKESKNLSLIFNELVSRSLLISITSCLIVFSIFIIFNQDLDLYFFFLPLLFAIEACSYEIGRFFWNIGEVKQASKRDFIKSIFFVIAVFSSIALTESVISIYSIGIIIASNILIISYEVKIWGSLKELFPQTTKEKFFHISNFFDFIRSVVKTCGPQFIQNQVIGFTMLVEKLFITALIGLSAQGAYSFIYSIVQTSAALFLMPAAAKTKQIIISDHPHFNDPYIYRFAIKYLPTVILFISVFSFFAVIFVPILGEVLNKNIAENLIIVTFAVFFSSSANAFMSSVSPLYSHKGRWVRANIYSSLMLIPFLLVFISSEFLNTYLELIVFISIAISGILQVAIRLYHFQKSIIKYE